MAACIPAYFTPLFLLDFYYIMNKNKEIKHKFCDFFTSKIIRKIDKQNNTDVINMPLPQIKGYLKCAKVSQYKDK